MSINIGSNDEIYNVQTQQDKPTDRIVQNLSRCHKRHCDHKTKRIKTETRTKTKKKNRGYECNDSKISVKKIQGA